jgi:hypothetical protein
MAVRVPFDPNVVESNRKILGERKSPRDAFVDNFAVSLRSLQRLTEFFARGQDIVEEPSLPKVKFAREPKSEPIILQRLSSKLQKPHLASHRDPGFAVLNLFFDDAARDNSGASWLRGCARKRGA